MKVKIKYIIRAILVVCFILASVLFIIDITLDAKFELFSRENTNISKKYLNWNENSNYIQTGNTCGSHSVMAILSVYNTYKDPYDIYNNIPEKSTLDEFNGPFDSIMNVAGSFRV